MTDKKLPLRKCVACGLMKEKSQLFRLVKADNMITFDPSFKAQGRGAYVCRNRGCLDLATKKKSFNRSFKCQVKAEVIDSLYREI